MLQALALHGASVTITDKAPLLPLTRLNIIANFSGPSAGASLPLLLAAMPQGAQNTICWTTPEKSAGRAPLVHELEWGSDLERHPARLVTQAWDFIVASDVAFDEEQHEPLLQTCEQLAATSPAVQVQISQDMTCTGGIRCCIGDLQDLLPMSLATVVVIQLAGLLTPCSIAYCPHQRSRWPSASLQTSCADVSSLADLQVILSLPDRAEMPAFISLAQQHGFVVRPLHHSAVREDLPTPVTIYQLIWQGLPPPPAAAGGVGVNTSHADPEAQSAQALETNCKPQAGSSRSQAAAGFRTGLHAGPRAGRILLALDFDWTMVEENSDTFVLQQVGAWDSFQR